MDAFYFQFTNNVNGNTEISVVSNNDWTTMITNRILWNPNHLDEFEWSEVNKDKWVIIASHPSGDIYFGMVSLVKSPLDVDTPAKVSPSGGIWNDLISSSWPGCRNPFTAWVNIYGTAYELMRFQ